MRTLQDITDAARVNGVATDEELRLAIVAYDVLLARLGLENDPKQLEKYLRAVDSFPRAYIGTANDPNNEAAREWHRAFINAGGK